MMKKLLFSSILLVFFLMAGTVEAAPLVDIKAEGSDGPVPVVVGDFWTYSWTSSGATACQLTAPSGVPGVTLVLAMPLSGDDGPISPGHRWYPAVGGSTTLTIDCTDGVASDSDSVTIYLVDSLATKTRGKSAGAASAKAVEAVSEALVSLPPHASQVIK